MAKTDNLHDFLKDLANTIRAKKGTSAPINPQNFSFEISTIDTSGGAGTLPTSAERNDVNFLDYDGAILASYTKDEFLALSNMPILPSHPGLICQGWNYALGEAQSFVSEYGSLDVGAMYITNDGKTRLYIRIAEKGRMIVPLYIYQSVANGVVINWGDGSAEQTLSGSGWVNTTHTYSNKGNYVITLDVANGCSLGLGKENSTYNVLGPNTRGDIVYSNMLQKVEIGKNVPEIKACSFANSYSLKSITIPNGVTFIGANPFLSCYSLISIIIPNSVTTLKGLASSCYALKSAVIPKSVTSVSNSLFNACYALSSIVIPNSLTSVGSGVFYNCYTLASAVLPKSITSIDSSIFYNCYSLASIVIPSNVTKIGSSAFYFCYGMKFYDFRALTNVPTLESTNAFTNIASDCKIVVPDGLYDQWKAATNWSTYSSYIVKASEFNA